MDRLPVKYSIASRATADAIDLCIKTLGPLKLGLGISDNDIFAFSESVNNAYRPDVVRYALSDPAKHGSVELAYDTTCCKAVMYYRIAHAMLKWDILGDINIKRGLAFKVYEEAKRVTGIDIHPGAEIGEGFVIDHGVGTVISGNIRSGTVVGETTIIGKNVTILNGVLLGARNVNDGTKYTSRRHPTIGNDVTICGNVQILGAITVGDNVFIGPGCIITQDIPAGTKCTLRTTVQMTRIQNGTAPELEALVIDDKHFILYGNNLENCKIEFVNSEYNLCQEYGISILEAHPTKLIFDVVKYPSFIREASIAKYIIVSSGDNSAIMACNYLKNYLLENIL